MAKSFDRHSPKFLAVTRRAFERRVLYLVKGFGPIQDNRFRESHEGASPAILFLRAKLEGEHPKTCVTIHTFDRAQDLILESRQLIWDPEFAEGDELEAGYMHPPEHIAEASLIRARAPELRDLTVASASDTEWRERYAAVERRAFELHVLRLIQENPPIQEARHRDFYGRSDSILVLRADLEGEYPKTRVAIYVYHRTLEVEQRRGYGIWDSDFAIGDVVDVEHMRPLGYIVGDIMMWARGG